MRTFTFAGVAALSLIAAPGALSAQSNAGPPAADAPTPTANEANARTVDRPPTTTVITDGNPQTPAKIIYSNPGNLAPPPPQALNRTYPVCHGNIQDSCQNPGEGGAPGRSRALGYWPGEPASERAGSGG